ncbi:MAG: L,D-transpeptidase family protein [Thermodesulfovibrionales bacterium]
MRSLVCILLLSFAASAAQATMIIGEEGVYTVKKGDTLDLIGARLGVPWKQIVRENRLDPQKPLKKGARLKVDTRRIVPRVIDNGIIVNIPDRTLYYFKEGQIETVFPVALGMRPRQEAADWTTPLGKFTILRKAKNPSWYVPKSIQEEMEEEGKSVEPIVPPGPDNPLGRYALKTSIPGILIHETIRPRSVYQYRSHGCIRVMPEHMETFFDKVEVNTPGELIYVPVKVAVSEKGHVFLEAHGDVYKKGRNLKAETREAIEKLGLSEKVDWQKVEKVLKERAGIPRDVTLADRTQKERI